MMLVEKKSKSTLAFDSPRISISRLEAGSKTSAPQTRHNGERRNDKW
jgi:hypothetical protein